MKHLLYTCLFVLLSSVIFAQDIEGNVKDDKGTPVFYATVALYNAPDSTFHKAEFTDETGNFKFKNLIFIIICYFSGLQILQRTGSKIRILEFI